MKKRNQIIPAFLVFFVLILAPILAHTVVKFGHDLAPRNSLDRIAPDASVLFPDADIQVTDKAEGDAYQSARKQTFLLRRVPQEHPRA